jgi:hypothetical protein
MQSKGLDGTSIRKGKKNASPRLIFDNGTEGNNALLPGIDARERGGRRGPRRASDYATCDLANSKNPVRARRLVDAHLALMMADWRGIKIRWPSEHA